MSNKFILDENGNSQCDPETTRYRFSFNSDGTIDCSQNRDPCKRDVCMCDKDFAEGVAQYDVSAFVCSILTPLGARVSNYGFF